MRKSLVIAGVLALVFAAGAGAASRFIITSTHQIKPSVLRQLHGARGARGPAGAPGTTGVPGAPGAAGAFSAANVTTVMGPVQFLPPGGVAGSLASCPAGSVVLGGGWDGGSEPPVTATTAYDEPLSNSAWDVVMANDDSTTGATFSAWAQCATGTGAHVARARSNTGAIVAGQVARVSRELGRS